jgi:rubrerythrin
MTEPRRYLTDFGLKKPRTPYKDVMPALGDEEFAQLKGRIATLGFDPNKAIIVDEEGNILDGHHRQRIEPDCPYVIKEGLGGDAEKRLFGLGENRQYRKFGSGQKRKCEEARRSDIVEAMRAGKTDKELSALSGIPARTLNGWRSEAGLSQGRGGHKRKLTAEQVEEAKARAAAGETQAAIAEDMGVTKQRVGQVVESIGDSPILYSCPNCGREVEPDDEGDCPTCRHPKITEQPPSPAPLVLAKPTDRMSLRVEAVRSAIKNGEAAATATGRLGFAHPQAYRKAKTVVDSGNAELIKAMDDGILSSDAASKIRSKPPEDIATAIEEARNAASIKRHNARSSFGKPTAALLYESMNSAYLAIARYTCDGLKKKEIPRSEAKRDELRKLARALGVVVEKILIELEKEIGNVR